MISKPHEAILIPINGLYLLTTDVFSEAIFKCVQYATYNKMDAELMCPNLF